MLHRHRTFVPGLDFITGRRRNQFDQHPIGVRKTDDLIAESLGRSRGADVTLFQPIEPITYGRSENRKCSGFDLTDTTNAPASVRPWEERQNRPLCADAIA